VNYEYNGKYLLELLSDAMDLPIQPRQPWGNFPAVSVGWRISEESFWQAMVL
jgi:hypothetical protein